MKWCKRSGFQLPRRLPHPDKRRRSALTAPLTMRSAAIAAPLPHTPAKSAGRARVFRFAKRNESTARLRRAAALSRLRRLRARAPAPSPHFADPRQRNFSYRVSSHPLCTALQKQSADRRSSPHTIMLNYSLPSSLRSGSSLSPLNTNAVQNPCCSSCANCLPSFFLAGRTVTSNSPWRVFA